MGKITHEVLDTFYTPEEGQSCFSGTHAECVKFVEDQRDTVGFLKIVPIVDKREVPLAWWNSMTFEDQFYKVIEWLSSQGRDTTERHPHSLTGREIELIYEHFRKKD
jgi:hypothetical protein